MTFWLLSLGKMEIRLRTKIQFWRLAKKEEEKDVSRETKRKFGDESSGDGESNQEGPVTLPFSLEEYRPWIEQSHFFCTSLSLSMCSSAFPSQLNSEI